jgi:hypothetical protein
LQTTGARGVLRLTSTEIFDNSQNTTKFTTKWRYVPRFLLEDKRIPSSMFPMCRRGNHLLNLSGRGAAAAGGGGGPPPPTMPRHRRHRRPPAEPPPPAKVYFAYIFIDFYRSGTRRFHL